MCLFIARFIYMSPVKPLISGSVYVLFPRGGKVLMPKFVGNWSGMYFRRLYQESPDQSGKIGGVRIPEVVRFWVMNSNWIDGEDVPCPLQAPLAFTYRKEGGTRCLSPLSQGRGPSNTKDISWWMPILFLRGTFSRYIRYCSHHLFFKWTKSGLVSSKTWL